MCEQAKRDIVSDGFSQHSSSDNNFTEGHIRLAGDHNNNRIERFNGELRQREKVMRSLKKADSPILSGMQIYHNYLRPHEALEGKTPAEKTGITVHGKDKWLTLIQNISKIQDART